MGDNADGQPNNGAQQPASLVEIIGLLRRMETRLNRIEGDGEGRRDQVVVTDIDEDAFLNPMRWTYNACASDIQRTALSGRLKRYFLGKAIDDGRRFDVREGEMVLRLLEKLLSAMVKDAEQTSVWSAAMLAVCAKHLEELLSLKILAEDGIECQRYFDSLRLAKSLPESLQKWYGDVKSYKRNARTIETAVEAARAPASAPRKGVPRG